MDSEDWKEFQKKGKEIRRGRMKRHRQAAYLFYIDHPGLTYTLIQEWQIRISDGKTTMDIYPQSKRYHNLTTNKRGDYFHLKGFLNSIFGNETGKGSRKGST